MRIPAGGGPPETVAELRNGELALLSRRFCPEAKPSCLRPTTAGAVDKTTIEVVTLADRHRKIVARGGASPRYLATANGAGHLVYVNTGTLFAIPFDSEHAGDPRDGRARAGRCRL